MCIYITIFGFDSHIDLDCSFDCHINSRDVELYFLFIYTNIFLV